MVKKKVIPKVGDMIGFSYNPAKTDGLVKGAFHVQMGFDSAPIVHIEMVYDYDKKTDTLITLGANFNGLMFRDYQLSKILPYIVVMRVEDNCPLDVKTRQDVMEQYFNEKGGSVGREYGFLSLLSGGVNQLMDKITFGLWVKLNIIPKNDLDCSGTCANLIKILWAGKQLSRKGQRDYIAIPTTTPGDIFNANGIVVVYDYSKV